MKVRDQLAENRKRLFHNLLRVGPDAQALCELCGLTPHYMRGNQYDGVDVTLQDGRRLSVFNGFATATFKFHPESWYSGMGEFAIHF